MQDLNEPLTEAEREKMDETFDAWIRALVTTPNTNRQSRFSPTEMAEFAAQDAKTDGLKAEFTMLTHGHAAVAVGYPKDYNVAQHPLHLRLQREHEMVTVTHQTIENPAECHDYEMVTYMHRSDYDDAVLSGAMETYR